MNTLHSCLSYYLLAINAVTFIVYGIDKYEAKKAMWRISEATLLMLAVLGGSIGAWIAMRVWRHKTMHKKFKYGIPVILLIQIALIAYMHITMWGGGQNDASSFFTNKAPTFTSQGFVMSKRFCTFRH